jgi:hypothetical protein
VPYIIDIDAINWLKGSRLQQTMLQGATHAVLAEVARCVFGTFRIDNLLIDVSSSPFDDPADEDTLLQQLMLEKKKAFNWLRLVNGDSSTPQGQYFVREFVEVFAHKVVDGLLSSQFVWWSDQSQANNRGIAEYLLPAARHVVAAAIKAQIICSCMHTRLIQLHVPGWHQPSLSMAVFGDAAPDTWSQWPGVVPLSNACMQVGASLPAAAGVLPDGVTAAAVYCMEPAVIHIVERMGQLGAVAAGAAQPPHVFKVIRKAKVCVANRATGLPSAWDRCFLL